MLKQGEIIFNNRSNLDFNLKLESYPVISSCNENYETKEVDGGKTLYINKGSYPDRRITFQFTRISDNVDNLDEIYDWLLTYTDNTLIYGREDVVYRVKKILFGDFQKEFATFGNIEITFICESFMTDYEYIEHEITNSYSFNYLGSAPTDLFYKVYGAGNIQITINDETMIIKDVDEFCVIDGELMQIRDKNEQTKDFDVSGDFITLEKGKFNISFTGNVTKIELKYLTRWR